MQTLISVIEESRRNLAYGFRLLRQRPAFAVAAVLTLGLCIGINSAVFTVIDGVFFRSLPYPEPDRLGEVVWSYRSPRGEGEQSWVDGRTWEAIRDSASTVDAAVYSTVGSGSYLASGGGEGRSARVDYVEQQRVSAGFFRVLGISMLHGREFAAEEDVTGGAAVVLLSHELWERTFASDPSIVGSTVTLGGAPHTVVGVVSESILPTPHTDLWTPLRATSTGEGSGSNYQIVTRLRQGHDWPEARAELALIGEEALKERQREGTTVVLGVAPYQRSERKALRQPLFVLWAAVAFVLLIGCTNLASMLIARGDERRREMATRAALGGGRGAVVRQLMAESLSLALVGGLLGVLLSVFLLARLRPVLRDTLGLWQPLTLDGGALAATSLLALITCLLFGVLPALQTSRVDVRSALSEGGRGQSGGSRRWPRRLAVVGQLALSVALLVGAGLLLRSLRHLHGLDPGFDPENLLVARVAMRDARYEDAESIRLFFDRTTERMSAIPGVEGAAVGLSLPFERGLNMPFQRVDGPAAGENQLTTLIYTTPSYLEVLGVPVLRGRAFDARDGFESAPVLVVNEDFVRRYFDERPALGATVEVSGLGQREIVGVVGNVQQRPGWGDGSLGPLASMPTAYVPASQISHDFFQGVHVWFPPTWIVRTPLEPGALVPQLQEAGASVDPLLPLIRFQTMDEVNAEALGLQRLQAVLLAAFAGLALALSAIGIYGVLANVVTARRRELGVRLALGASHSRAIWTVTGDGLRLVAVGLLLGIPLAISAAGVLRGLFFGVEAADPITLIGVVVLLLAVGLMASLVPAWKVSRLDPAETLRSD